MLIKDKTKIMHIEKVIFALGIVFIQTINTGVADNRSDQMNPNNDAYWDSRGYDGRPDDWEDRIEDEYQSDVDNRSNQLNPNNDAYWKSRGYDGRPDGDSDDYYDDYDEEKKDSYETGRYDGLNPIDPGNNDERILDKEASFLSWFFKKDFPWLKLPAIFILMLLMATFNRSNKVW